MAFEEIPPILSKPMVNYRIHKKRASCPFPEPDQSSPLASYSLKSFEYYSPIYT
jgi:hypothetical protein